MQSGLQSGLIARVGAALLALGAVFAAPNAGAEDFYRGKTLEIIVSSGVGADSYDALSRLVARHIGPHLPGNPNVVVRNMPGAAGILAANQLYNLAPRDGTTIGMLDQSIYETQLFKVSELKADVTKMNWVGRVIANNAVLFAWHTAAVQKIADAYAKPLIVCSTGSAGQLRWTMLKRLLGLKLQLVTGYKGTGDGLVAMERGEVEALSMPWTVFRVIRADWLRDHKVNVVLQTGLDAAPDLPGVPRMVDLGRNAEERQILELFSQPEKVGRSFTAPPGLPAARVAELRAAFTATLKDAAFVADAARMRLDLSPLPGAELQTIIEKSFDYSPAIIAKAEALIH
ncbi:MAG TPA: tripartite tricarboxylate transporter substrate-binding protein [Xanthobacteraceae bacterium]|nr:tripartite tricarboxylate transporter substrate-binding protein [Xanthobacteraceae bacterium]